MDTCAVEVGLLSKKPCGHAAVAKCANCEMALCNKHAVAQLSATKQRTGKNMCAECDKAQRAADKGMAAAPHHTPAKPTAAPAAKPAAAAPAAKPAAPAPAAKAPAVAPTQPAGKQEFKLEETGPIEFTPTKK
jgi:hypothetical protein